MDHKVSKDMISSGMIPSGEKKKEDLGRTQYGSAPSPSSLADAYKSMYDKIMKGWKKNRSVSIKSSAYDTYFGLSTAALASDDEFEVKEDATKAEIKRAFGKSLKGKKMNKKILSEFIELVA